MSWSLGEISALCTKATRGVGHPWGVAEEAGWAMRWLAQHSLPGAEALAGLLPTGDRDHCPLIMGMSVADTRDSGACDGADLRWPLLLLPFLGRAAPPDQAVRVSVDGVEVRVSAQSTDLVTALPDRATVTVLPGTTDCPPSEHTHRIDSIAPNALATLCRLAEQTYAPATEASRSKGAGAGLTDND